MFLSGEGIKSYTKSTSDVDSADPYGRVAFISYKVAYAARVVNSMAITAIVFKGSDDNATFSGPATPAPNQ